jgi:hypothetical protein
MHYDYLHLESIETRAIPIAMNPLWEMYGRSGLQYDMRSFCSMVQTMEMSMMEMIKCLFFNVAAHCSQVYPQNIR